MDLWKNRMKLHLNAEMITKNCTAILEGTKMILKWYWHNIIDLWKYIVNLNIDMQIITNGSVWITENMKIIWKKYSRSTEKYFKNKLL